MRRLTLHQKITGVFALVFFPLFVVATWLTHEILGAHIRSSAEEAIAEDVLKEARQAPDSKDIPILVMSAVYRDPSNIRIARDLGAKGFLNKDSIVDTVIERLQTCLAA